MYRVKLKGTEGAIGSLKPPKGVGLVVWAILDTSCKW